MRSLRVPHVRAPFPGTGFSESLPGAILGLVRAGGADLRRQTPQPRSGVLVTHAARSPEALRAWVRQALAAARQRIGEAAWTTGDAP